MSVIPKGSSHRWTVCMLLFAATTINYIDRQVLGLLKPTLENEFNWSEKDYSYIVIAFTTSYALGLVGFGRIIDRVGTKLGYSISVTIWSFAAMAHALARSTFGFGMARAALGVGESGNFPAAVKTVAEWFPKRERALATGIFDSGSNIGACVAPLIVSWILEEYGWQYAFVLTGAIGFVWIIVWRLLYENPANHKGISAEERAYISIDDEPEEKTTDRKIPWTELLRQKPTWSFIAGKFFTDPIWHFFLFWLPSYFSSIFHLDLKKLGLPLVIIYCAATVGAIGGGYLSSWLIKRGWTVGRSRKFALLFSALLVLPIMTAKYASDMWVVITLIAISVAGNAAWSANIYTIVSDMLPKKTVSSVIGIGGMAGALGGVLFPLFIGSVLDYYKSTGNLIIGYNLIFVVCGCSFLLAWLIIHWLTPTMQPVTLEEADSRK